MSAEFIARPLPETRYVPIPLRFILSHIARHPVVGVLMILGGFSNAALPPLSILLAWRFNAVIAGNQRDDYPYDVGRGHFQFMRGCLQLMRNFLGTF